MNAILVLLLLQIAPMRLCLSGDTVTLTWDANPETDLQGYKIHYGTASRSYSKHATLGTATTFTVTGLTGGQWFFAATAFNLDAESGYSNEVSVTIPLSVGSPGPIGPQGVPGQSAVQGPFQSIIVTGITMSSATISWATTKECSGTASYGTVQPFTKSVVSNNLATTDHLSALTGLVSRTHYLYQVSGICNGLEVRSEVRSFNTK